jgi:hypothetical protein
MLLSGFVALVMVPASPAERGSSSIPVGSHTSRPIDSHNNRDEFNGEGSFRDYFVLHGTKFAYGYYYRGQEHSHWTHRYWLSEYGCECFYCPSTYDWYYWYAPRSCYYPVSYIGYATPRKADGRGAGEPLRVTATAVAPAGAAPPPPVILSARP